MSDSILWSGPSKALDAHLDLFRSVSIARDYLARNVGKKVNVAGFPAVLIQRCGLLATFPDSRMEIQVDGESVAPLQSDTRRTFTEHNMMRTAGLLNQEYECLNEGETHYVSHHVMATLETAAEAMEDEPLFPTDLPTPTGLIVLEYPLILPDLHPETGELRADILMPIRAIGWTTANVQVRDFETGELTAKGGIHYTLYADETSFQAIYNTSIVKALGPEYETPKYLTLPVWASDATAWAFGMPWKTGNEPNGLFGAGLIHANIAMTRRWLLAYFRWSWQRILIPERYSPKKYEKRRAQRMGRPMNDEHIKVLRLRREVEAERNGESQESTFAYTYQWVVRAHPRRQWYPSLGPARNEDGSFNRDSHRLIWIEPHLAGNPFGPLVSGHNVTAAVR